MHKKRLRAIKILHKNIPPGGGIFFKNTYLSCKCFQQQWTDPWLMKQRYS